MRYFLLVGILCLSLTCIAAIYMQKDANGNVTYSDMPATNATRVDLPPVNTTNLTPPSAPAADKSTTNKGAGKATSSSTTTTTTERPPYTVFSVSSPVDQQTFQNQRDVSVTINIIPALQKGDTIQLYVDGNKIGEPAATANFQVNQLPRGTHQVSATLLDANKEVLKQAPAVTFFVHYAALGGAAQ